MVMVAQGCQTRTGCDLTNELLDARATGFTLTDPALTIRAFHQTILLERQRMVISIGGCQPRTCSWWNETYNLDDIRPNPDAGVDAGAVVDASAMADAGAVADAGRVNDVGAAVDVGALPPPPRSNGNCACRATTSPRGGGWAALALVGLLARVRRGRRGGKVSR